MYVLIFSPQFPRLFYWSAEASREAGSHQYEEDDSGESYLRVEAELEDISTQTEDHTTFTTAAAAISASLQSLTSHPSPYTTTAADQHQPYVERPGSFMNGNALASSRRCYSNAEYSNGGVLLSQASRDSNSSSATANQIRLTQQPAELRYDRDSLTSANAFWVCFTTLLSNMCASNKKLLMITTSICACASFAFLCIAVATDRWIEMREYSKEIINNTNVEQNLTTYAGLWNRCNYTGEHTQDLHCTSIKYFTTVEREGLGPTETIILSMRRTAIFPLISLVILLAGLIVCFTGHCHHRRKIHTFAAGILYVVGGLCTLIGMIIFIGGITAEASHKRMVDGKVAFKYKYGHSFIMTVLSFILSELTGVLSVYLYISRHKHAYKKKQERMTINEQQPSTSQFSQANHRNYHGARSLSRERSHEYSPSHSDTLYTYTPVSDTSKEMSNYTFPREPSRYTIATPVDTHSYIHHGGGAHSHDVSRSCAGPSSAGSNVGGHMYRAHAYSTHSMHSMHDTTSDMYANRREMDTYPNRNTHYHEDPYARRTTPV